MGQNAPPKLPEANRGRKRNLIWESCLNEQGQKGRGKLPEGMARRKTHQMEIRGMENIQMRMNDG